MNRCSNKKSVFLEVVKYTAAHGFWLAIRLFGAIVNAAVDIAFAYIIASMIDSSATHDYAALNRMLLIILITVAIGIITAFINRYSSGKLGAYTVRDIKNKVVQHIRKLPVSYMERTDSGQEMSRLTIAMNSIQNFVENELPHYVLQPLRFIAAVVFMAFINWKLLLFTIIIIPIMIVVAGLLSSPISKYAERIQRCNGNMNSIAQDGISGIRMIKAFNLKDIFIRRYGAAIEDMLGESLLLEKRKAIITPMNILIQLLPMLLCFGFGGLLAIKGQLSIGELIAFVQLINYIVIPASLIPGLLASLNELKGKAGYVLEIFDEMEERKPESSVGCGKDFIVDAGSGNVSKVIEFNNVDFYYNEEKKILENVSFVIGSNAMTALVSESGGGKSTVMKLICGFYEPVGGEISIYGKNISTSNLEEIRRNISLVPQNTYLFPGTVSENIGYGKLGATFDEIVNAAKKAGAHDFIMELPEGYNTMIGEKGSNLSGGQCQRLSIARALISGRPILLLDEPTSALDSENEAWFNQCLESISQECTVIIAAHRLSTVKRAKRIIVLKHGKVAAEGSHDQLIINSNVYKELYERQMQNDQADEAVILEG